MDFLAEDGIIIRGRLDKGVEIVHNLTILNDNQANRTNAGTRAVSGLKIYRNKIIHTFSIVFLLPRAFHHEDTRVLKFQ